MFDGHQDAGGEVAVAGVLGVAADRQDRYFFGLGVEVAGDGLLLGILHGVRTGLRRPSDVLRYGAAGHIFLGWVPLA
ncbi:MULTISPECIES: hypothetical protein [Streptomyces]|uniref:hypothetical protein n=1 Tax=Streptomyces herbicida TaxID=3065675 RepID=UPI00292CD47D|nr:hypothetical protein [Streptomyces sp. NEAU-HV9]